jgi:hypothetical protein
VVFTFGVGLGMNILGRITEQNISIANERAQRINDNVLKGFHARFGPCKEDGTRLVSYYFFYRIGGRNGRQVNYFIGNSQSMDAGLARRIAMQIEPHVKAGKDILKMKFEGEKEAVRFKDYWRYLGESFVLEKYKNGHDICRQIKQYVLPQIGSIHLKKLNHRLICLRVVDPIIDQEKLSVARSIISYLKQILQHAVAHDYITMVPMNTFENLTKRIISNPAEERVHLSGSQIKGIFYRASKSTAKNAYLFTLRLQILSGQSLATICRSYRQDIKGNKWLLRDRNGKLNGKLIPLDGPLKALLKQGVKDYTIAQSLYLLPGKGARGKADKSMDPKSLAKHQKQFTFEVHGHQLSMSQLLVDVEQAMLHVGVTPLVVAYLFHKKVESYLQLAPDDPMISDGLQKWYRG